MKWFFQSVGLGLILLLIPVSLAAKKKRDPLDLVNVRLSPAYSQWMVGATGELATADEIDRFLALSRDEDAESFVKAFWKAREGEKAEGEEPSLRAAVGLTSNPLKDLFDERALEADKLFSEAGYLGRRTARGTIYILFGAADESDYEVNPDPRGAAIELWLYDRGRRGLDGSKAERRYRFIRKGDLTIPYTPNMSRQPVRTRF